jgi:cytochrome d ubiquinol oxidase subunit II
METAWLLVLGFLLAGYFVLAGYDYGVQLLLPAVGRDERERRTALAALGPFFFGNEVWLVAVAGVLFGAFPFLEGTLIAGLYPLVVTVLCGLVLGKAAVQLRGRVSGRVARHCLDALVVVGGAVPAVGWGIVFGVLLHGVPRGADGTFAIGPAELLDPFVLLCGVTTGALFAGHGAVFLALRTRGWLAERAGALARPLLAGAVLPAIAAALVGGIAVPRPEIAAALAAVLVLAAIAAQWAMTAGRVGGAFALTSVALAVPVPLLGAASHPYVLVSTVDPRFGMTVTDAAADGATLAPLTAFGVVVLPVVLAYQAWSWWVFRGRVDSPGWF